MPYNHSIICGYLFISVPGICFVGHLNAQVSANAGVGSARFHQGLHASGTGVGMEEQTYSYGLVSEKEKVLKVNEMSQLFNKPSLKPIQTDYGDVIDCVDIYKQPAFDHPSLKNHTIQMKPSLYPITKSRNVTSMRAVSQSWWRSGSCPMGTIPMRRIRKQELLKATSLENYGRKYSYITHSNRSTTSQKTNKAHTLDLKSNNLYVNRSTAILVTEGYDYKGAKGDINVWNPYVEKPNEYSASQVRLISLSRDGRQESVEAGWMVNPTLYGDTRARFFIYWTVDRSIETGCFDLICTGFVQTNHEVALGSPIEPVSIEDGEQYAIGIFIFQDVNTSNWWLTLENKEVGYWPGDLFVLLKQSANAVHFGGEVYSETIGKEGVPHTSTEMGSGHDARGKFGIAAYIRDILIIDDSLTEKSPETLDE